MVYIPAKKYFTIKETSQITKVPAHVLRYWEKEFQLLRPIRRESGQRRYTSEHIHLIEEIKELLYKKKFTIAGAKKELLKKKTGHRKQPTLFGDDTAAVETLKKVKKELLAIFKMLSKD